MYFVLVKDAEHVEMRSENNKSSQIVHLSLTPTPTTYINVLKMSKLDETIETVIIVIVIVIVIVENHLHHWDDQTATITLGKVFMFQVPFIPIKNIFV